MMSLDQIEQESEKDLELRIDRTDIDALETPKIHNKYLREYRICKGELIKQELVLNKMSLDKWKYYSGKAHPKEYEKEPLDFKIMKSDVKRFIEGDSDIIKQVYTIKMLELKLNVIRKILDEINKRSFHIKNAVDSLKFKQGVG